MTDLPYQISRFKTEQGAYRYTLRDNRSGKVLHACESRDPVKAPERLRDYQARLNTAYAAGQQWF